MYLWIGTPCKISHQESDLIRFEAPYFSNDGRFQYSK
jgi:hypothetical protein